MRKWWCLCSTEPSPVIGIFYSHHRVQRRVIKGRSCLRKNRRRLPRRKGDRGTFFSHAAGWPARVINVSGGDARAIAEVDARILLVGRIKWIRLGRREPGWKPPPAIPRGRGTHSTDDESVSPPVTATKTGMRVAAYQPQGNVDPTPLLIARNQGNMDKLRAVNGRSAIAGLRRRKVIRSGRFRLCGDTLYVPWSTKVLPKARCEGDTAPPESQGCEGGALEEQGKRESLRETAERNA